jgi:hypothetical protein
MPPSAANNPAEVAKALKRASHTNKLLLAVSLFLVCMLVIGGGTGLYLLHSRNQRSVQLPPPVNRGAGKGTAVGQPPPSGTAEGGKGADRQATSAAQGAAPTTGVQAPNPYAPSMDTLIVNDPMTSNQLKWDEGGPCKFGDDGYHILVPVQQSAICYAHATNYANFTYEAQITFLGNSDVDIATVVAGLVLRGDNDTGSSYRVEMDRKGGSVALACKAADNCVVLESDMSQQPLAGPTNGADQTNKLAIVAFDNSLSVFLNGQEIFRTRQARLSQQGMIGVYARGGRADNGAEVVFSNVKVWQL